MNDYIVCNDGHIEYYNYRKPTEEIYNKYLNITKDWNIITSDNIPFYKFKILESYSGIRINPIIFINEIFLPYPYNDRYWVSNIGNVIDIESKIYKIPFISKKGYLRVFIHRNKFEEKYNNNSIHRMVAETYMPIENSKKWMINHKNSNKMCNNVENLEWCNNSYNVQHSYDNGMKQKIYSDKTTKIIYDMLNQNIKPHDIANYLNIPFNHAFSSFCWHIKKGDRRIKLINSIQKGI